jgi:hypothetical protein
MASKRNNRTQPARKPTHADAEILLKLYELRRDDLLRKARNFVMFEFSPRTNEEFLAVASAFGTQEQTYCRMVWSYWEQAASLATHGVIHPDLFDEFSGELFFIYAKYKDFIPALRTITPTALLHVEKVANRNAASRERVQRVQKMIAERRRPQAAKTGT